MGEVTKIEWCHHTFSGWFGCDEVSAECDNCYARELSKHYGWAKWGTDEPRKRASQSTWRNPISWNRKAASLGVRRRVFCALLSDVGDNRVPLEWFEDLMSLVVACPNLDWLLLTKRPSGLLHRMRNEGFTNTWIGTTVGVQSSRFRAETIVGTEFPVRFLSCEPLLGPVRLDGLLGGNQGIDWVIAGAESGPKARPMDLGWVRLLRDQCVDAKIPFFYKQGPGKVSTPVLDGRRWVQTPGNME